MKVERWTPGINFSARRLARVGRCCRAAIRGEGELNSRQGGASVPASRLYSNSLRLRPSAPLREQSFRRSSRQSGVALVITLILLSVTLVMAVAFLAISRRERGSVTTETDTTTAKFAADAALAQAEAQITSGFLTTTNPYISSLLVSTNYIYGPGFATGSANPTNVNYNNYLPPGGPLSTIDMEQNIANLQYLPRPPVYATNYAFNYNELQFYLDLNRNGRYDTNGLVQDLNYLGTTNGLGGSSLQIGDPEWIGILEHPDAPHSANNPFIARYAFIAVPADSLDLNRIHNQALDINISAGDTTVNPAAPGRRDSYSRNQGIGPWEINLAAFLTDLNTNRWDPLTVLNPLLEPYAYPEGLFGNSIAFDDARALIAWRYGGNGGNYALLANANGIFNDPLAFVNNGADYYALEQQATFDTNYAGFGNRTWPWLGAQNTNNFFNLPAELFDPNKSSLPFTNSLSLAGTYNSTYDRYTYYRLLGQLGTDTSSESDKINLNYSNAVVNYDASGLPLSIGILPGAETNFVPWVPIDFFTAAADKLLHTYSAAWFQENPTNFYESYYGQIPPGYVDLSGRGVTNLEYAGQLNQVPSFGITNIPVYVNGQFVYSSAVNRLLQLAANIYDASTNTMNPSGGISNYPSVFRPVFWVTNEFNPYVGKTFTDVYIKGYQYVVEPLTSSSPPIFNAPLDPNTLSLGIVATNVWGVPWIIGAKKGFPNFNAFEMVNIFSIERELQITRSSADIAPAGTFPYGRTYTTNQMYIMSVSNSLGVEDWNSYATNYNNRVTIVAQDGLSVAMTMTNNAGVGQNLPFYNNYPMPLGLNNSTNVINWSGYLGRTTGDPSFVFPLSTNTIWLTNSVFHYGPNPYLGYPGPGFVPISADPSNYLDSGTPPLPQLVLQTTNHLQAYMLDSDAQHAGTYILDYVQLAGMNSSMNVNQAIADNSQGYNTGLWSTNFYSATSTPQGVIEQILTSQTGGAVPSEDVDGGNWNGAGGNSGYVTPGAQQAFFSAFFTYSDTAVDKADGNIEVSNFDLSIQAPFTPTRVELQKFVFEANDPLVHYLASDLNDFAANTNGQRHLNNPTLDILLGAVNNRYMPWGSSRTLSGQVNNLGNLPDANSYNLSYKDPLVSSSDNWDFPTNKYPTVGWLGRVHRGTPWQSVYLKSSNILAFASGDGPATWEAWTGDQNPYDVTNSAPIQDRLLFDLFTATPNSYGTPGQLNVNVGANDYFNPMAGLASWSALLSGAIAFSNNVPDNNIPLKAVQLYQRPLPSETGPIYTNLIVQPYGAIPTPPGTNPTNSPMWQIVSSINGARTNYVGVDGLPAVFEHAGDILSAPQLAERSPFLNWNNSVQQQHAISDEMYEWLPQQIMSLVTVSGTPQSPPRYVIYCYGQTLKPAPDGIVTSGQFFGLCTNYQVIAESASRAIIRVDNTPTPGNPTA
ncbi:MAG TPA: hypothetical protein VGJ73_14830, partial [Verrucomicrobiae bacterium]